MGLRSRVALVALAVSAVAACGGSVGDDTRSSGAGGDAGGAGAGLTDASADDGAAGGADVDAEAVDHGDGPPSVDVTIPDGGGGYVLCGGASCAAGWGCCLTTGTCFDPQATPAQCPKPAQDGGTVIACASNADCPADQFCDGDNPYLCLGPGHCADRIQGGGCIGCEVCGCDGTTYSDKTTANASGVRAFGMPMDAPCGAPVFLNPNVPNGPPVIFCGEDSQCPAPQLCCAISGRCFDPAKPGLCEVPPPGADNTCLTTAECQPDKYCKGSAPCDSVGACVALPKCDVGVLSPVCGCDGVTYANEGCAAADGMRIGSSGSCTDGG